MHMYRYVLKVMVLYVRVAYIVHMKPSYICAIVFGTKDIIRTSVFIM